MMQQLRKAQFLWFILQMLLWQLDPACQPAMLHHPILSVLSVFAQQVDHCHCLFLFCLVPLSIGQIRFLCTILLHTLYSPLSHHLHAPTPNSHTHTHFSQHFSCNPFSRSVLTAPL
ncbi:hypothetical protein CHARACLAT_000731 [Characodon lateralis]|uniref:Secreted protein n=1 Tax=Characodon lateralis TaxID=208331 RepID=A0ABU7EZK5_9TELE|nr:hypothetical protein [Characodon lateralis]